MREKPLILLVDDEEVFLEIASTRLHADGLATEAAHDFYDAIRKAELLLPDLVLSDIYMPPGPSGWDLALALRRNPKTHDIKFAFLTTLGDPWAEAPLGRGTLAAELGNITFFNKMDAVETLGKDVSYIIGSGGSCAA